MKHALFILLTSGVMLPACSPQVKIVAPDKPIEINLNVRIDQDVRIRLEDDIEDMLADNPDLF